MWVEKNKLQCTHRYSHDAAGRHHSLFLCAPEHSIDAVSARRVVDLERSVHGRHVRQFDPLLRRLADRDGVKVDDSLEFLTSVTAHVLGRTAAAAHHQVGVFSCKDNGVHQQKTMSQVYSVLTLNRHLRDKAAVMGFVTINLLNDCWFNN